MSEEIEKKEVEEVEEVEEVKKPEEEPEEKKREIMTIEEVMIMLGYEGDYDTQSEKDKILIDDVYNRFNRVVI